MKLLTLFEHSLIAESKFDNLVDDNLQLILNAVKPYTDSLIQANIKAFEDMGKIATKLDIESIELSVTIDLILAVSKYIKSTDVVKVVNAETSKGVVAFNCEIIRDNELYFMNTEMIYASGEVQRLHYRYLVKSNLPKINNSTAADKLIVKQKNLGRELSIAQEIETLTATYNKNIKNRELQTNKSDEQIIPAYIDKIKWNPATYPVESDFDTFITRLKQSTIELHRNEFNPSSLKRYVDDLTVKYNKQLKKLQTALSVLSN